MQPLLLAIFNPFLDLPAPLIEGTLSLFAHLELEHLLLHLEPFLLLLLPLNDFALLGDLLLLCGTHPPNEFSVLKGRELERGRGGHR
jgi:hypothetical protein